MGQTRARARKQQSAPLHTAADETIELAVNEGAIEAVVPLLSLPPVAAEGGGKSETGATT